MNYHATNDPTKVSSGPCQSGYYTYSCSHAKCYCERQDGDNN